MNSPSNCTSQSSAIRTIAQFVLGGLGAAAGVVGGLWMDTVSLPKLTEEPAEIGMAVGYLIGSAIPPMFLGVLLARVLFRRRSGTAVSDLGTAPSPGQNLPIPSAGVYDEDSESVRTSTYPARILTQLVLGGLGMALGVYLALGTAPEGMFLDDSATEEVYTTGQMTYIAGYLFISSLLPLCLGVFLAGLICPRQSVEVPLSPASRQLPGMGQPAHAARTQTPQQQLAPPVRASRLRPVLIMAMLLLTLGGGAWFQFGDYIKSDRWYLPDNPAFVCRVDWAGMRNSDLGKELEASFESALVNRAGRNQEEFKELLAKLATVTVGGRVPKEGWSDDRDPEMIGIIRMSEEMLWRDFIAPDDNDDVIEVKVAGKTVMVRATDSGRGVGVCQLTPRLVILGTQKAMEEVLNRMVRPASLSRHLAQALKKSDPTRMIAIAAEFDRVQVPGVPARIAQAIPKSLFAEVHIDSDIRLNATMTAENEAKARELLGIARPYISLLKISQTPGLDDVELNSEGKDLVAHVAIDGEVWATQVNRQLKLQQCATIAHGTNNAIDRYYFEVGKWPKSLDELARYYPEQTIAARCPIDGRAYELDHRRHIVKDHAHAGHPRFVSTTPSSNSKCVDARTELTALGERYYFEIGRWPESPAAMAKQFPDWNVPTTCPIDGRSFEFDVKSHRVREHRH